MSAAMPTSEADRANAKRASGGRSFFRGLVVIACSLLFLGGLGFSYLRAHSPLGLFSGSERPIAAATVLVPSRSPFTISLLAKPERLIALQQAVTSPSEREQARREISQVQQTLFQSTGLDYERDVQPWAGEEITYAYVDADLDQDVANGQQPGSLLAIEIAPDRQPQAQSFLQLFWQQQSLLGNVPQSQMISGVRVLSGKAISDTGRGVANLSTATALVGDQFVILANDVRVIRRSIRASQTAQNLAQNLAYRQAVDALPPQRVGLAYLDTALLKANSNRAVGRADQRSRDDSALSRSDKPSTYTAIGIGITPAGLTADLSVADIPMSQRSIISKPTSKTTPKPISSAVEEVSSSSASAALQYLPENSELAIVGDSLAALKSALTASGVPIDVLPEFLQLGQLLPKDPWAQVSADYALAQLSSGRSRDWILAVKRDVGADAVVQSLNQAATAAGYSVVPVPLGEASSDRDATAWTRFKVGKRRQASSALETELLGLHLQQDDYELYASSLAAMNSALAAPAHSLRSSPRFLQAIAPLEETANDGYLYIDWPVLAPMIDQTLPMVGAIDSAARPLSKHIRAITATRRGDRASFFIQLKEIPS